MKIEVRDRLNTLLPSERILYNEPMKKHTTLRIGGEAECLVMPVTIEEISEIIRLAKENEIPYYVIGNGSNLLVSDEGFQGIIVKLTKNLSEAVFETEHRVKAQAGIMLSKLASMVAANELTGFEFAAGIPGTLGGAVAMNAGAYGGDIKQRIVCATVLTVDGDILVLNRDELQLAYRSSIIEKMNYIVLDATFEFEKGESNRIQDKINEYAQARREKQPLDKCSAGSTFKRPEGFYAGKLIMDSGLRGYRVGDAAVSEKHCGFVVNLRNATARDFYQVILDVQRIVYEKFQVKLEPEVKCLGRFSDSQ